MGSAKVSVNEWTSYFNLRSNEISLRAGTELMISLKPTSHVASEDVMALDVTKRNCRIGHEGHVRERDRGDKRGSWFALFSALIISSYIHSFKPEKLLFSA